MSKFHTDTNRGRVGKMQDIIALLAKSARSNKASLEDIRSLFEPVISDLHKLGLYDLFGGGQSGQDMDDLKEAMTTAPDFEPGRTFQSPVDYRAPTLVSLARKASMEELHQVVTHYHLRVDDIAFAIRAQDPDTWDEKFKELVEGAETNAERMERLSKERKDAPAPESVETDEKDEMEFNEAFADTFEEEDPFD